MFVRKLKPNCFYIVILCPIQQDEKEFELSNHSMPETIKNHSHTGHPQSKEALLNSSHQTCSRSTDPAMYHLKLLLNSKFLSTICQVELCICDRKVTKKIIKLNSLKE